MNPGSVRGGGSLRAVPADKHSHYSFHLSKGPRLTASKQAKTQELNEVD